MNKNSKELSLEIGLALQKCGLALDNENFEKIKPYLKVIEDDVLEMTKRLM